MENKNEKSEKQLTPTNELLLNIKRIDEDMQALDAEIAKASETKGKLQLEMKRLIDEVAKTKVSQDSTSRKNLADLLESDTVTTSGVVDSILKTPSISKSINQQRDNVEKLKGALVEVEKIIQKKGEKKRGLLNEQQAYREFISLIECHTHWCYTASLIERAQQDFQKCVNAIRQVSDETLKSTYLKKYMQAKNLNKKGFPIYLGLSDIKAKNLTEVLNAMGRIVDKCNPFQDLEREKYAMKSPSGVTRAFKELDEFTKNEFLEGHEE
ncbi:MAG: hypothetical protein JSW07_14710 [bacterium]|nr:MAG: hypothetical protein JSW07_14710 [bacterium]